MMETTDAAETGEDRADFVAGIDERPQRRREWAGGVRSVVVPLLAVVAIVAGIWYLQSERSGGAKEAGTGIVALPAERNPTGKPPAVEVGRAAPDFVLRTLDGGSMRLSDLRGKTVIINFWATWCGPCRQEVPELVRAYAAQRDRGLEILAVDLQESDGPVRDFADEFGMQFPIVMDRDGAVASAYRADKPPTSIIVDRQGIVRAVKLGPMSADFLRDQLTAVQ